ncbi:MAG TPA: CHAT domain-containing protein [Casimicrobiaceae bacterium]|nr:CHAT domain-containing protein [Casimicrobiaceae bacterium]
METLYPDLRPSDLHPLAGSVLTVDVSLSPAEVEGTSGEVHITREAPDVVRVLKVHLLSDKSSQWDTLEYSISAGTQKPAHFVLTAPTVDEPDHSILELRANFYLNNRWCGEGVRNLDVRRDAGVSALARIPSPKVPEWRLGLTLEPDATPPDLIVRILKTTHVGEYDWSCLSPHLNLDTPVDPVKRTMALGDDAQTYVRNRFQPLAGKSLANIDIADIEGIGQAIYDSTPEVFKDAYWALWSAANEGHFPFDSIQIVTDEPYIPWELMRVYDAKRAPDVDPEFLAVRHCIGRWLAMDAARLTQHISVNATAVAASDYSQVDSIADKLPWAAEEKKLMMDTYRAEEVVLKSDPLLKFLKDGRVQALHFACHGKMSITNPLGSQLILEDTPNDLKPTMVNRPEVRRGLGSEHPMVFLNACEVGGGAASLTLVAGFPAAFLSAGASAVISPLWVVNDAHAKTIAATFYEQVLRKDARPLGEVLREVHSRWRDEKHLTYLAYVLYGDPLAAVAYRA